MEHSQYRGAKPKSITYTHKVGCQASRHTIPNKTAEQDDLPSPQLQSALISPTRPLFLPRGILPIPTVRFTKKKMDQLLLLVFLLQHCQVHVGQHCSPVMACFKSVGFFVLLCFLQVFLLLYLVGLGLCFPILLSSHRH